MKLCKIEDCGKIAIGKNLCMKHYQRYRRHGDPLIKNKSGNKLKARCYICGEEAIYKKNRCFCEKHRL